MNLNSFFDKIYCINLDFHTDRWRRCKNILERFNIEVERFPGIVYQDKISEKNYKPGINRNGEIGCTLSHLSIIKTAKNLNYNNVFIFEDDVILDDDFNNYLSCLDKIPDDWDMIYLGWVFSYGMENCFTKISKNLYKLKYAYCTHAYGVNKKIFDKFLELDPINGNTIDKIYAEKFQLIFNCYGIGEIRKATDFSGIVSQDRINAKSVIRLNEIESGIKELMQGNVYFFGENNEKINFKKAFHYWIKGAKLGNIECIRNVYKCYLYGKGVKKNYFSLMYWELMKKITEEEFKNFSINGKRNDKKNDEIIRNKWLLINDWNDQENGSYFIQKENDFEIHHREWGKENLWLINAGNIVNISKNDKMIIRFKIINEAERPIKYLKIGFTKDLRYNKKDFIQIIYITEKFDYIDEEIIFSSNINGVFSIDIEFNDKSEKETKFKIISNDKLFFIK